MPTKVPFNYQIFMHCMIFCNVQQSKSEEKSIEIHFFTISNNFRRHNEKGLIWQQTDFNNMLQISIQSFPHFPDPNSLSIYTFSGPPERSSRSMPIVPPWVSSFQGSLTPIQTRSRDRRMTGGSSLDQDLSAVSGLTEQCCICLTRIPLNMKQHILQR